MKHTPTPWKYKETKMHRHIITGKVSDGSEEIAEVNDLWVSPGAMKANAEFIVKAVNGFDMTVEALKCILKTERIEDIHSIAKECLNEIS